MPVGFTMKSHTRPVIMTLAAVALAASLGSVYVHYQLVRNPSYTSFCDISATVSCETAFQSRYATVAGVPVAAGGAAWSALVLLLAWRGMREPRAEATASVAGYIFVLSTIGLSAVLYYAYASFVVLQNLCLLCATMYVAVIGIFIASGAAASMPLRSLPSRAWRDARGLAASPAALTLALLWLVGSASLVAFFPRDGATSSAPAATATTGAAAPAQPLPELDAGQRAAFVQWFESRPRVPLTVPNDGARVLVVKFNDYQCPPCRQTFMEYKPVFAKYAASHPGQVKAVTMDFPLEPECNTGGPHPASCEAAAAVRMARAQGKAEALEDWLFDNQPAMTPALVRQGVQQVAGVTDFDAQYPRVLEQVRADVAYGRQLGVNRTPTFFINGIKIDGGLQPQFLDAAIAHELQRAQAKP